MIAREECVDGSEDGGEEDGSRDLEDDENEEGNWRNDYPDEDPMYYESIDAEYFSGRGIRYLMCTCTQICFMWVMLLIYINAFFVSSSVLYIRIVSISLFSYGIPL